MMKMFNFFGFLRNITIGRGNNITNDITYSDITNSKITVNGNIINGDSKIIIDNIEIIINNMNKEINIVVNGNITLLKSGVGNVIVNGAVGNIKSSVGNVRTHSVVGDIITSTGNVTVEGNITGNVKTNNGNIKYIK